MSYGTIVVPYSQPNGPRCSRVKPWVVAKQLWSIPRHVPYWESKLPLSSRAGLGRTEDPKNRDFPWFCRAFLVPFPWWNIAKQVDMTSRDGICWPRWLCQGLPFYNMPSVAKASWSCWHAWPLLTSTMRRDSAQSNQRKVREVQAIYAQVRSLWEDSFHSGVVALFWFGIVHSDLLPQLPVQWDFSWVHDAILAWVFWAWELNWDVFVYKMLHRLFATRTIWARCNMLPRRIWTGSGWILWHLWCIGWLACRYHDVIMKRDAVRSSWWGRADSRWAGDQSRPQGIVRAVSVGVRIFPDRLSIDLQRFLWSFNDGLCSVDSVDSVQFPYWKIHGELLRMFISWGQDRLIAELTQQLHAAHDYILQQMGLKDLGFARHRFIIQLMMSRTRELSCNSGSISFEDVRHAFPFATACFFCHFQQKGQWYYGRVLWGGVCFLSARNRYCNCKLFFLSVQSRQ